MSAMMKDGVSIDDLRAAFVYAPETGLIRWRERPLRDFATKNAWAIWNSKHAFKAAGWIDSNGYRLIRFKGKCLKGSRVAWAIARGEIPEIIDHQDGDKSNDRLENLRNVSLFGNAKNRARGSNNTSGASGIYRLGINRFAAQINAEGQRFFLGVYHSFDAALAARKQAEREYGFHPNHDRAPELRSEPPRHENDDNSD